MKIKLPGNFPGPAFLVLCFILSLSFASMNAMTQTKKIVLKDFTFFPFTSQASAEDPLDLPYHSKSPLVSIDINPCYEYNSVKDFLDMHSAGIKKYGSKSNNEISWVYTVKNFVENPKYDILTGMVINNASGAKILVTMKYPANNKVSVNNSIAMLNTFRANAPVLNTEPVKTNNPPKDPVKNNPIIDKPANNVPVNTTRENTVPENTTQENTGSRANTINIQQVLDAHNVYRKELGLPLLKWSDELADYAQKWVNELSRNRNCEMLHRPYDEGNPWYQLYGENIFSGGSGYTAVDAVESWGSEKKYFDKDSRTCKGDWSTCGHYTQIIWKQTRKVGCAVVTCTNGDIIIVCNYDPAGNVIGEKAY